MPPGLVTELGRNHNEYRYQARRTSAGISTAPGRGERGRVPLAFHADGCSDGGRHVAVHAAAAARARSNGLWRPDEPIPALWLLDDGRFHGAGDDGTDELSPIHLALQPGDDDRDDRSTGCAHGAGALFLAANPHPVWDWGSRDVPGNGGVHAVSPARPRARRARRA